MGLRIALYTDTFEGIRPDDRGPFKWQSGNLYYRYAKDGEFGVARVNTGGTTTKMIGQSIGNHQNHLNFAFDITNSGVIYFVYAEAGESDTHTVVNNYNLAQSGGVTISDDLSSYNGTFQLQVNITGHHSATLTVAGTDKDGNPVSQQRTVTSSQTQFTLNPIFASVTSITENFTRGRLTITTIPLDGTQLVIKRRTSSGTETTVLESFKAFGALTDLDDTGGVYLGCHEALFHNNFLYLLAPIGRVDVNSSDVSLSRSKAAGMVLYRCDVTAGSPSLTVLDKWDFVHQAGCNLIVHDGNAHFVEQPNAATAFKPINPDLDGYWSDADRTETMGYNVLPESLGALKKISSSGEVEHLGNIWHTDRPYNVFPTRMLSIDGDLHLSAGLRESWMRSYVTTPS